MSGINDPQVTLIVRNGIAWVDVSDNASISKKATKLKHLILLLHMGVAACRLCAVSVTGAMAYLQSTAFKMPVRFSVHKLHFVLKRWRRYSNDQGG